MSNMEFRYTLQEMLNTAYVANKFSRMDNDDYNESLDSQLKDVRSAFMELYAPVLSFSTTGYGRIIESVVSGYRDGGAGLAAFSLFDQARREAGRGLAPGLSVGAAFVGGVASGNLDQIIPNAVAMFLRNAAAATRYMSADMESQY